MLNSSGLFKKFGKKFQAGSIIFCEFEQGNDFYLIQSGQVQISKIIKNIDKTMDILNEGDIFGEMAILEEQPRSATAIALTQVEALNFNRENFVSLMTSQPQLALKLLIVFSNRIHDAKKRLMILLLNDLHAKIADTFVMLAEKENKDSLLAREVVLKTDIEGISHWCAESASDIQTTLDSWARMGKIDLYSDKILINNINDFRRIADSKRRVIFGR